MTIEMETLTLKDFVLTEKDFYNISQMVYDHCGINLHDGKKELVRARLAKRLRLGKFRTFQEYLDYVLADKTGMEFSILIDSISTNLTSFFREDQHFKLWSINSFQICSTRKDRSIISKFAAGVRAAHREKNLIP
jgi:chemotaxis methyl-accepting protein methylase